MTNEAGSKERCDQDGRSKDSKKDHFEITPNPEFDTRSWPTVNANGMKSRSKFNKRHFGGFGARGVQDAIAAGKFKKLLRFMDTKSDQVMC